MKCWTRCKKTPTIPFRKDQTWHPIPSPINLGHLTIESKGRLPRFPQECQLFSLPESTGRAKGPSDRDARECAIALEKLELMASSATIKSLIRRYSDLTGPFEPTFLDLLGGSQEAAPRELIQTVLEVFNPRVERIQLILKPTGL